jgi:hypothetical protein
MDERTGRNRSIDDCWESRLCNMCALCIVHHVPSTLYLLYPVCLGECRCETRRALCHSCDKMAL